MIKACHKQKLIVIGPNDSCTLFRSYASTFPDWFWTFSWVVNPDKVNLILTTKSRDFMLEKNLKNGLLHESKKKMNLNTKFNQTIGVMRNKSYKI